MPSYPWIDDGEGLRDWLALHTPPEPLKRRGALARKLRRWCEGAATLHELFMLVLCFERGGGKLARPQLHEALEAIVADEAILRLAADGGELPGNAVDVLDVVRLARSRRLMHVAVAVRLKERRPAFLHGWHREFAGDDVDAPKLAAYCGASLDLKLTPLEAAGLIRDVSDARRRAVQCVEFVEAFYRMLSMCPDGREICGVVPLDEALETHVKQTWRVTADTRRPLASEKQTFEDWKRCRPAVATADATAVVRDPFLVGPAPSAAPLALRLAEWVGGGAREGRGYCCSWKHVEGARLCQQAPFSLDGLAEIGRSRWRRGKGLGRVSPTDEAHAFGVGPVSAAPPPLTRQALPAPPRLAAFSPHSSTPLVAPRPDFTVPPLLRHPAILHLRSARCCDDEVHRTHGWFLDADGCYRCGVEEGCIAEETPTFGALVKEWGLDDLQELIHSDVDCTLSAPEAALAYKGRLSVENYLSTKFLTPQRRGHIAAFVDGAVDGLARPDLAAELRQWEAAISARQAGAYWWVAQSSKHYFSRKASAEYARVVAGFHDAHRAETRSAVTEWAQKVDEARAKLAAALEEDVEKRRRKLDAGHVGADLKTSAAHGFAVRPADGADVAAARLDLEAAGKSADVAHAALRAAEGRGHVLAHLATGAGAAEDAFFETVAGMALRRSLKSQGKCAENLVRAATQFRARRNKASGAQAAEAKAVEAQAAEVMAAEAQATEARGAAESAAEQKAAPAVAPSARGRSARQFRPKSAEAAQPAVESAAEQEAAPAVAPSARGRSARQFRPKSADAAQPAVASPRALQAPHAVAALPPRSAAAPPSRPSRPMRRGAAPPAVEEAPPVVVAAQPAATTSRGRSSRMMRPKA
ncbi:hypothetical protein M885DRAFT_530114 [Pelagophyceae sp. CCMP2097]|nr:hypothetical protein M885DRAFT_530114 [Pelagophyceae sp. CCMP2097]